MLTVITGPMFSGKTTELIRRMRCAQIAGQRTLVLKPTIDTRSGLEIVTHAGVRLAARNVGVDDPSDLPRDASVIGVDEAQFLGEGWVDAFDRLADAGTEIILACLNQDFRGRPFGIAPRLLAMADQVCHLKAVCTGCGRKDGATRTWRTSASTEQVELGGADKYRARCRSCWAAAAAGTSAPAREALVA